MPKKIFIITLILFPLVVGLACRFTSSPDPTATPTEEPVVVVAQPTATLEPTLPAPTATQVPVEPTPVPVEVKDLTVLEKSKWIQDESTVFVGYLIENPSSDITYEDVEFEIQIFGSAGNLIDSSYAYVPMFYPNTTQGVASTFWISDESVMVDSVDIKWTFKGSSTGSSAAPPLTTDNLIYWDNDGFPIVTGKIVNNTDNTYTNLRTDIICYDSAGEIVGGGISYLDFIHLNDYMGFTTYVDTFGDVASLEAYPSTTYSTDIIDKTDFVSEISIPEHYYYTDDYGYLQGGMILQNTTESVLRNSHVYITFYDEDKNIVTTGGEYLGLLLPGDTLGISPWVTLPPEGSYSVDYDILLLPGEIDDTYELDSNPFTVNTTTVTGDFNEYVMVNFTNTYSKQVSEVDVHVLLYNAEGQIIGGGSTWTDEPTPAGDSDDAEVYVSYGSGETIDTIKAWVIPSTFTDFE